MTTTFVQRLINVTISLGKGDHGEAGADITTFYGARVLAQIEKTGSPGYSTASIRLFGLNLDHMNKISSLGMPVLRTRLNTVRLEAGNLTDGMATVFIGDIYEAWADFNAAPEVSFNIEARPGVIDAMKPIPPGSYTGPTDAAVILSGLATQMGYAFENNGVSVILAYPYHPGTAREQAEQCRQEADILLHYDDARRIMAIWPKGGTRGSNDVIPLISSDTGMFGYPAFIAGGIRLRVLYNPAIHFGGLVKVVSSLKPACGIWHVSRLSHQLESFQPGGAWFSDLEAYRLGNPALIPG